MSISIQNDWFNIEWLIKNLRFSIVVGLTAGPQRRGWGVESVAFKAKNDAQTTSEHLQNKFQKPQKTGFLTLKMVKMTLSEGQILTQNFDFRGQISTFCAENTPKSWPFKTKNNA